MLDLSYTRRLSPRLESKLATLFTPSPSRVGHPSDPYRRVSVTQPGPQGPDAANDPACLRDPTRASGPGRRDNSACLRDSVNDPAWRLGTANDLVRPRDAAKASGPVCLANLGSLRDLIYGLGVRIIKLGLIIAAASGWPNNLRGTIWQKH